MDIMSPAIDEQPSPAPWLKLHGGVDVCSVIDMLLAKKPAPAADEIARELRSRNLAASFAVIASCIRKHEAAVS